jgi:hypothetical protein
MSWPSEPSAAPVLFLCLKDCHIRRGINAENATWTTVGAASSAHNLYEYLLADPLRGCSPQICHLRSASCAHSPPLNLRCCDPADRSCCAVLCWNSSASSARLPYVIPCPAHYTRLAQHPRPEFVKCQPNQRSATQPKTQNPKPSWSLPISRGPESLSPNQASRCPL